MRLFMCITLALFALLQLTQADEKDVSKKDANDYMDYILKGPFTKETEHHDVEKKKMPTIKLHFKSDGKDINVLADDGRLTDNNEIERMQDCVVKKGKKEKNAVSCTVVLVNMLVKYHVKIDVTDESGKYSGTNDMDVDFKGTEARIKMEVHKKNRHSHVKKFDVSKNLSTGMTTELDDFTGDVSKVLDQKMKRKILSKLNKKIRKALRKLLKKILESAIKKSPHLIKDSFKEE